MAAAIVVHITLVIACNFWLLSSNPLQAARQLMLILGPRLRLVSRQLCERCG